MKTLITLLAILIGVSGYAQHKWDLFTDKPILPPEDEIMYDENITGYYDQEDKMFYMMVYGEEFEDGLKIIPYWVKRVRLNKKFVVVEVEDDFGHPINQIRVDYDVNGLPWRLITLYSNGWVEIDKIDENTGKID